MLFRGLRMASVITVLVACSGTQGSAEPKPSADASMRPTGSDLTPGVEIRGVRLGMAYPQVKAILGEASAVGRNRLIFGRYESRGLEIIFASSADTSISDDAIVIGIGATAAATLASTPRAGQSRRDVIVALGPPTDTAGTIDFYASGISIAYDRAGVEGVAQRVSVFDAYVPEVSPPEMTPPKTSGPSIPTTVNAATIGVVDMHLHPGRFGRIPPASKSFLIGSIPPIAQPYAPGVLARASDPYAPFVGIRAQTDLAGVSHAVLFAVYTQKTTGFTTNEDLEAWLVDPRNTAPDGLPWAWGLASIDFFNRYVDDPSIAKSRLAALAGYFERRRDLFIGIKLAHAHQAVAFDDARYLGVYDVAAKYSVPIYLHTGFSPFPGAATDPAYYDPLGLENTIRNLPGVSFVLGHVGQGDRRATLHAFTLAQTYPNVYLEISALNRPLLRDDEGHDVTPGPNTPQYPFVLAEIRSRGLVDKTFFGTDGPQFSGMVKGYVSLMTQAMKDAGYTADAIRKVMGENFAKVFFRAHGG